MDNTRIRDEKPLLDLSYLLKLAGLGYRIFPIQENSKIPLNYKQNRENGWELVKNAARSATSDQNQIREWHRALPKNNWGLACGHGMFALDRDLYKKNPDWPEGDAEKADLENHPFVAQSARGGQHLFFRLPIGKEWSSWNGGLAPGVDIKVKEGGYVVLAGSVTPDGAYKWMDGRELNVTPEDLPDPPGWLVAQMDAVVAKKAEKGQASEQGKNYELPTGDISTRVRAYLAKIPHHDGTGGSGGHRAALDAARAIMRFGLRDERGFAFFADWNSRSTHKDGPLDERQLRHKWTSALKHMNGKPSDLLEDRAGGDFNARDTDWEAFCKNPETEESATEGKEESSDTHQAGAEAPKGRSQKDRVEMVVTTGDAHIVCDQVTAVLSQKLDTFDFGGALVEVVTGHRAGPSGAIIREWGPGEVTLETSRYCRFVRKVPRKDGPPDTVPMELPGPWLKSVLTGRGSRHLEAIHHGPTMDAVGRLLNGSGYDPETKVYFANPVRDLEVPEKPTLADARAALSSLAEMYRFFPWRSVRDWLRFLAALFGTALRDHYDNSPLFLFTGSDDSFATGSGKSLILDSIMEILNPGGAMDVGLEVLGRDGAELEKKLVTMLVAGKTILKMDDLPDGAELNNPHLRRHLTEAFVAGRLLTTNREVTKRNNIVVMASGNDVSTSADMGQRILRICLRPVGQDPRARKTSEFQEIGDLRSFIRSNRGQILGWIFTVIRAWRQAGSPCPDGEGWGSYEGFVANTCGLIRWVAGQDPISNVAHDRAEAMDPNLNMAMDFATGWHAVFGIGKTAWVTPGDVCDALNNGTTDYHRRMADALAENGATPGFDGLWKTQTVAGFLKRIGRFPITLEGLSGTYRFQRDGSKTAQGNRGRWRLHHQDDPQDGTSTVCIVCTENELCPTHVGGEDSSSHAHASAHVPPHTCKGETPKNSAFSENSAGGNQGGAASSPDLDTQTTHTAKVYTDGVMVAHLASESGANQVEPTNPTIPPDSIGSNDDAGGGNPFPSEFTEADMREWGL